MWLKNCEHFWKMKKPALKTTTKKFKCLQLCVCEFVFVWLFVFWSALFSPRIAIVYWCASYVSDGQSDFMNSFKRILGFFWVKHTSFCIKIRYDYIRKRNLYVVCIKQYFILFSWYNLQILNVNYVYLNFNKHHVLTELRGTYM